MTVCRFQVRVEDRRRYQIKATPKHTVEAQVRGGGVLVYGVADGPMGPQGPPGPPGAGFDSATEVLTNVDGIRTTFTLGQTSNYPEPVQVYRNGLSEVRGIGFTVELINSSVLVTMDPAPLPDDIVSITYIV